MGNGIKFIRPDENVRGLDVNNLTYVSISENLKNTLRELVLLSENPGDEIIKLRGRGKDEYIYINNTTGVTLNLQDYDYTKVKDINYGKL